MSKNFIDEADVKNIGEKSLYEKISPFPNLDISFNWIKRDYPFIHSHNHFEILVVTSGKINNVLNDKSYILSQNEVYFIRPDDKHKLLAVPNCSESQHINFLLKSDYVKHYLDLIDSYFYETVLLTNKPLKFTIQPNLSSKIINSCIAMQSDTVDNEYRNYQCKILVNKLLNTFIESYYPQRSIYPDWFSNLLFSLNNPRLKSSTAEIANKINYSYSHLTRIFKELMGTTITNYIKKIKMEFAASLIKNTDKTILEIAEEINYDSISYFNHSFKNEFGMTPSEMRKRK